MRQLDQKIGFIGGGNMGEAMIGALIQSGASKPDRIFVSDIRADITDKLKNTYKINVLPDNPGIIQACDVIVFAVKPQSIEQVLSEISENFAFHGLAGRKLIISIAAGILIKKFEEHIYPSLGIEAREQLPILRVMPNTPAMVLAGISGLCANTYATPEDMRIAKTILSAMGEVVECEEKDMDAITAMSGSGPAYCFYFVEAMIEAGIMLGFDRGIAVKLTVETMKGALALLEKLKQPPETLRRRVTSPGGTTEAAIKVFEEHSLKRIITQAITSAAKRSKELSG